MPKETKYGWINGGENGFPVTIKASQLIRAASAKFVVRTGVSTATVTMAGATDTEIIGHLECEELNSSDGTEVRKCISDATAVFRIPVIGGTYAATMLGKKCDIAVSSGVQGAALNSATYGVLEIVGGDVDDNYWVDVRIKPSAMSVMGVA